MKRVILIPFFLFIFTSFTSLNAQWALTYGGSDSDVAQSIQQTNDGGYIVAGDAMSFGAGLSDIWVLKLDSNGAIIWQRTYGGSYRDIARSIQQTGDGGYIVAGDTESFGAGLSDIWVLKLDSNGATVWQRTYGGSDGDVARSIQQTGDGGYIVAGNTESFSAGLSDIWILKLNSDGAIEWQQTYGGSDDDAAYSVSQTGDGGYVVAGNTESFGAGLIDIWILKLNSDGAIEWQQTYGEWDYDFASFIQQTSDEGYIVAAYTYSFVEYWTEGWILKLDSNGAIEWQRTYGASSHGLSKNESDFIYSIQQTGDEGYIAAGVTSSFGAGVNDAWLLKLSSSGAIEWQQTYGGSDSDVARTIQQTEDGGYIAAGTTESFGAGVNDFFVFKLYSDGNIDPSCGLVGSSEATIADTYISPEDTNIIPKDTNITAFEISASPYDTDASVYIVCPAHEYTLNISADYGGTTDPSPGSYRYEIGEVVTITAKADSGYKFGEWNGDVTGKDNPVTITMDSDKSLTAIFRNACFLAKVFSGSPLYAQLKSLRDFRDKYLTSNRFGLSLVNLYYRYSQFFAEVIAKHKALKVPVSTSLLPLIAFSYSLVHLGPLATAIIFSLFFILPAFLDSFFQRKLSRVKTHKI